MDHKRTEINQIGEFGLINKISKNIKLKHKSSVLGIGDDAALIDNSKDKYQLVSSDMMIEGIHFDLSYYPLKHLGYKIVSINVSDICAMNGIPRQITINIGISNRFSVEAIEELYKGINSACEYYNIDLIGGDTTNSKKGLIISGTIIGEVDKTKVTKRSTANINDIICVTGDIGGAYLGLQILNREKNIFLENPEIQPDMTNHEYIIKRQLMPKARTDIINILDKNNIVPTSMIDISDGLASEILHITNMSQLGSKIFEEKVPFAQQTLETAKNLHMDPFLCAFNGGEDYELLFTIDKKNIEKIKKIKEIIYIGYTTKKEEGVNLITKNNKKIKIESQGWEHFKI